MIAAALLFAIYLAPLFRPTKLREKKELCVDCVQWQRWNTNEALIWKQSVYPALREVYPNEILSSAHMRI